MTESTQTEITMPSIAYTFRTYMTESWKHTHRNNHNKYCLHALHTYMTESIQTAMIMLGIACMPFAPARPKAYTPK